MLKVTSEKQGATLILKFAGEVTEDVNLAQQIAALAPDTVLNCRELYRMNSVGVKTWIQFFQGQVDQHGVKLRLTECSPAIVEQLNLIMNFACGGTVESIYLPFCCNSCKKGLVALFKVEDLRRAKLKIPDIKCNDCGGTAAFDDIHEEYFKFLTR